MSVSNRVAVITGAASGLGLALTEACLKDGMHVVMADNNPELLEARLKSLGSQVLGLVCDVTKPSDLQHVVHETWHQYQRVDYLFNNAGISGPMAPLWELSEPDIRNVLEVNVHGVINGIKAFLPRMFQQTHRSHIINMSSLYGLCSGSRMAAYAMSKHALVALSESLYFDLKRLNKPVDVSVACPSFVNTNLLQNSKTNHDASFHTMLCDLIERSRPAEDVARQILQEVYKQTFYILPDHEVKTYCEQRTEAILTKQPPYAHNLEKIISALSKRALR